MTLTTNKILAILFFLSITSCINNPEKTSNTEVISWHDSLKTQPKQVVYRNNGIELYEYYREDGTLKTKISIEDGIRNGPAVYYYSNGNIRYKLIYKDGKKEGPYESYYLTGELSAKGAYKDDKKTGAWKLYDKEGNITKTDNYNP